MVDLPSGSILAEIQSCQRQLAICEQEIATKEEELRQEYDAEEDFSRKKSTYFSRWGNEGARAKLVTQFSEKNRLSKRYLSTGEKIVGDSAVEAHLNEINQTHTKIRAIITADEDELEQLKTRQQSLNSQITSLNGQYQTALNYEAEQAAAQAQAEAAAKAAAENKKGNKK